MDIISKNLWLKVYFDILRYLDYKKNKLSFKKKKKRAETIYYIYQKNNIKIIRGWNNGIKGNWAHSSLTLTNDHACVHN